MGRCYNMPSSGSVSQVASRVAAAIAVSAGVDAQAVAAASDVVTTCGQHKNNLSLRLMYGLLHPIHADFMQYFQDRSSEMKEVCASA